MAKKVTGYIKLQIPAGKATPAPPVGPALGQHGVNIVQFTKEFNARTADKGDLIIPVVITVYQDRTFSFITKTPPAAVLLKKYCNIKSGSGFSGLRSSPIHGFRYMFLTLLFASQVFSFSFPALLPLFSIITQKEQKIHIFCSSFPNL